MKRIYLNGSKWYYEYDGEIIAVEYSPEMVEACGDARMKKRQPTQLALDSAIAVDGHVGLLAEIEIDDSVLPIPPSSNANRWADVPPERC